MTICLNCGKECEDILCAKCLGTADAEALCRRILDYDTKSLSDYTLDKLASTLQNEKNLCLAVFGLSDYLDHDMKQYYRMLAVKGKNNSLPKSAGKWFIPTADELLKSNKLTAEQKQLTDALRLTSCIYNYDYEEAEKSAERLYANGNFTVDTVLKLSDYYIKTRRYDRAERILNEMIVVCADEYQIKLLKENLEDSQKRSCNKKAEYLPKDQENIQRYINFMNGIGIDVTIPEKKARTFLETGTERYPKPVSDADYPEFADERRAGFRSFVAYDLETTGLNPKFDSIIEFGAVKVRDGVIVDRFQKLAKPFKNKVSERITELTGITPDMVKDAPEMWDVFNEFADFAGDDVLVGYNNRSFDNKFLRRAGRYAHRIMKCSSFDVMYFASDLNGRLGLSDRKLSSVSEKLGIKNPEAHRALADAETTALVYLALLDLGGYEKPRALDDILSDDWK